MLNKKIIKVLISFGLLVAVGFSAYGIFEWDMTRVSKTTGLFCPSSNLMPDKNYWRNGNLYKIEENKRGITKVSKLDKWVNENIPNDGNNTWSDGYFFREQDNLLILESEFKYLRGQNYTPPQKGTIGWRTTWSITIDRTTLIKNKYDADGNLMTGGTYQCKIDNELLQRAEEEMKVYKEATAEARQELIKNRKF